MQDRDQEAFSLFDAVLSAMMDASRTRAEGASWLPALVLMAIRVVSSRTQPGGWHKYTSGHGDQSLKVFYKWIFSVFDPLCDDGATKRLGDMLFRADEMVLKVWLYLVERLEERLDFDHDVGASRAFADWFGKRLDDPEMWSGGGYGVVVPPTLARLMASLAKAETAKRVLDPACGVGGLLAVAWQMGSGARSRSQDEADPEIFSFDRDLDFAAMTRLRLYLLGFPYSMESDRTQKQPWQQLPPEVDAVVSAPPAGAMYVLIDFVKRGRWYWLPGRVSAEAAVTVATLDRLALGGHAALLIPKGLLFRAGDDSRLRRNMLEEGMVSAVISLPAGILAPFTQAETAVLFLTNREEHTSSPVIMIDASDAGSRQRRRAFLSEEECATILRLAQGDTGKPGPIRVRHVFADMIEEADFDLRPERYIEREQAAERRTLEERRRTVQSLESDYQRLVEETESLIERLIKRN